MNNRNVNNKTLDRLTRQLFERPSRATDEIENIVSNAELFTLVKQRIVARPVTKPTSRFPLQLGAFAAIAATVAIVVGAISLYKPEEYQLTPVQVVSNEVPDAVPEVARPVFPPQEIKSGKLSAGRAAKTQIRSERVVNARRSTPPRLPRVQMDADGDFIPIAYTGDPTESAAGGHIVRVDMKRSSLFALGIPVALENDEETIKADLLVGRDGVTRAVRLVN